MQQDALDVARTLAQVHRSATPWRPGEPHEERRGELVEVVGAHGARDHQQATENAGILQRSWCTQRLLAKRTCGYSIT
jgi:hypothetical protein